MIANSYQCLQTHICILKAGFRQITAFVKSLEFILDNYQLCIYISYKQFKHRL
jgi:hypothetical protein